MSRTWKLILLSAAAALLVVPQRASAAGDNKVQAGLKLAQQFCVECHVVVPSSKQGWTDAPTFESIANRKDTTVPKLVAFIQQSHMLNTGRSPVEADEIATYIMRIMSLRKK